VWTSEEDFTASVQVAHYGKTPIKGADAAWSLTAEDGTSLAKGSLDNIDLELGSVTAAGNLSVPLAGVTAAKRLRLEVAVRDADAENSWDIWVYPESVDTQVPPGVTVATTWNRETLESLENGGRVLLLWPGDRDGERTRRISFLPIFWSTVFFGGRYSATTLGVFCDPQHPALHGFPTEAHSNWQWWELTEGSSAFILNDTPMGFRPIVQMIDDLHSNDKLGAVFETRVGRGKLLVSSFDLTSDLQNRPVARQLRHSLLTYMSGDRFEPSFELDRDKLDQILARKDQ
jgi:hypothetical protein